MKVSVKPDKFTWIVLGVVVALLVAAVITVNRTGAGRATVPAGTFDTWRVKLDTGDSEVEAWIGTDAPHPLVKYTDTRTGGMFELMEFTPGGG